MQKRVVLAILVAAVVAVSPAFAAKKKDTYNLHGTLSLYTAPVGSTPGSVTIVVTKANNAGSPFVTQTLVFSVDSSTQVKVKGGAIVDGDHGRVQIKGAPGLDATGLMALTPQLVVDQT